MPRGKKITDLEKIFLRKAFIDKYAQHFPNIEEEVKQNSSVLFEHIKGIGDVKKGQLSASTWRNLFHPQEPYKPTGATLDGFYRVLFSEGRTAYLNNYANLKVDFEIIDEPQRMETNNTIPLSTQQDGAQIAVLQKEKKDLNNALVVRGGSIPWI